MKTPETMISNVKARWFTVLFACFCLLITLTVSEFGLHYLLSHPKALNAFPLLKEGVQFIYHKNRNLIQFDPSCAKYDVELGYRLKPGSCMFEGGGSEHLFEINSEGLRDDNASLFAPQIIVLGDSLMMGWGVSQSETVAEQLESATGKRVLNAAVSSYGTVRAMKLLGLLDTSQLEHVVIQYHKNDLSENRQFQLNNNQLKAMSLKIYRDAQSKNRRNSSYFFGKFTWTLLLEIKPILRRLYRQFIEKSHVPIKKEQDSDRAAKFFINSLIHASGKDLENVSFIVFASDKYCQPMQQFTTDLRQRMKNQAYPSFVQNMQVLDLDSSISPKNHCYILDDHMTKEGHKMVTKEILKVIQHEN